MAEKNRNENVERPDLGHENTGEGERGKTMKNPDQDRNRSREEGGREQGNRGGFDKGDESKRGYTGEHGQKRP